jgi:four helix bundle protein
MATYKDLDVYQRSFQSAVEIYKFSLTLPQYLQFDIADQIRRAARSIPSNIAEGYSRNLSHTDIIHFLRISIGSNDEILFNLNFIKELGLLNDKMYQQFYQNHSTIGKQLYKLIGSLQIDKDKKIR